MKKIWILMIALMTFFLSFSGCESTNGTIRIEGETVAIGDTGGLKLPLTKKGETVTWAVASNISNLNELFVAKSLQKITGVKVQFEAYPSATIQEKIKVLAASKKLPDIVGSGFGNNEQINDLGAQGAFVPVDENLDMMPNFKRIFKDTKENNWVFESFQGNDGHLYVLPNYLINRTVNHGMLYRKDIFDKHGIKPWTNQEEFYQNLKELKALYPDSDPFTSKNKTVLFTHLGYSWGIVAYTPYYNEETKLWAYSDTSDEMKDLLDFLKKLYDEKLLDPEFLTLTEAAWTAKMTQENKAFTTFDWVGRLEQFTQQTRESNPSYDLRYGYPIGPKGTFITLPQIGGGTVVSNTPNSELALKLSDFMLSPAGAELVTMGEVDKTYKLDENNKAIYLEFPEKNPSTTELEEKYGMFVSGLYKRFDQRSTYFKFSDREQEAIDLPERLNKFEPADPILGFKPEEKAVINEKMPNLRKAAEEAFMQYILGTKSGEAAWTDWKQKAVTMGSEEIVEIYNRAQKRMK